MFVAGLGCQFNEDRLEDFVKMEQLIGSEVTEYRKFRVFNKGQQPANLAGCFTYNSPPIWLRNNLIFYD